MILAKEQVQVLGVAPDPGVRLQRVGAADHGLEALLLQDRQRAPVGIALFFLLRRHLANLGTAESGGKRAGQESGLAPGGLRGHQFLVRNDHTQVGFNETDDVQHTQ